MWYVKAQLNRLILNDLHWKKSDLNIFRKGTKKAEHYKAKILNRSNNQQQPTLIPD